MITFASKHEGALTAHFINQIRMKLKGSMGMVRKSKELRDIDVTRWVQECTGLTELRDRREALTLATVMNYINMDAAEKAMDTICMRLVALQRAKAKDGSWQKACKVELIPEQDGDVAAPGGAAVRGGEEGASPRRAAAAGGRGEQRGRA